SGSKRPAGGSRAFMLCGYGNRPQARRLDSVVELRRGPVARDPMRARRGENHEEGLRLGSGRGPLALGLQLELARAALVPRDPLRRFDLGALESARFERGFALQQAVALG